jgi:hypothetical protein
VDYIQDYIAGLRSYIENVRLANKLEHFWKDSELSQQRENSLDVMNKISRMESDTLLSLISAMHYPLAIELNKLDTLHTNCQRTKIYLTEKENLLGSKCQGIENQRANLEAEKKHLGVELRKIWWLKALFFPGNKKQLQNEITERNQRILLLSQELDEQKAELLRVQNKKKEYANIEGKFEPNSNYQTLIVETLKMTKDLQDRRSELTKYRGFYERTAELTEAEQLRIMKMVLQGDEQALSQSNILLDIVDQKHLREVLMSVINTFRSPDTIGLTPDYRTDVIYFIVSAPDGIWSLELSQYVKTALSGYVSDSESADYAIFIREADMEDPWKVRFLLMAGKATPRQLNAFQDMKRAYEATTDTEMTHSYLLEQGIQVENDDYSYINNKLQNKV